MRLRYDVQSPLTTIHFHFYIHSFSIKSSSFGEVNFFFHLLRYRRGPETRRGLHRCKHLARTSASRVHSTPYECSPHTSVSLVHCQISFTIIQGLALARGHSLVPVCNYTLLPFSQLYNQYPRVFQSLLSSLSCNYAQKRRVFMRPKIHSRG